MLAVISLPANAVWNFDGFTLKIKISNWLCLYRETGDMWDCWWGEGYSGCLQTSYTTLLGEDFCSIMACWPFFQGLKSLQHIEGWAVCFPCVVFYVLKYCSENSWVGCNECFQRPSFERGFFPVLGGHHPFSCSVRASLIVSIHKGPLCEPVSVCASATR